MLLPVQSPWHAAAHPAMRMSCQSIFDERGSGLLLALLPLLDRGDPVEQLIVPAADHHLEVGLQRLELLVWRGDLTLSSRPRHRPQRAAWPITQRTEKVMASRVPSTSPGISDSG